MKLRLSEKPPPLGGGVVTNWVKPSEKFTEWDRIDRLERIHVDPE